MLAARVLTTSASLRAHSLPPHKFKFAAHTWAACAGVVVAWVVASGAVELALGLHMAPRMQRAWYSNTAVQQVHQHTATHTHEAGILSYHYSMLYLMYCCTAEYSNTARPPPLCVAPRTRN